jgi:hypothetical protein
MMNQVQGEKAFRKGNSMIYGPEVTDKGRMFSLMWKIGPNANTNIIIYTSKYIQNMFPKVRLLQETRAGGKEKNDRG